EQGIHKAAVSGGGGIEGGARGGTGGGPAFGLFALEAGPSQAAFVRSRGPAPADRRERVGAGLFGRDEGAPWAELPRDGGPLGQRDVASDRPASAAIDLDEFVRPRALPGAEAARRRAALARPSGDPAEG